MTEFDWVAARSECSLVAMFQTIKLGVKSDVERRNELRKNEQVKFYFREEGAQFSVAREATNEKPKFVEFAIENGLIQVTGTEVGKVTAWVSLNNDGNCVIKTDRDKVELTPWQFRRLTLEYLFWPINVRTFNFGSSPERQ